jgi:hypothetical protein
MGNLPATGNVTFYPKANALVMGDDVFQGLDTEQRQLLERARPAHASGRSGRSRETRRPRGPTARRAQGWCWQARRILSPSRRRPRLYTPSWNVTNRRLIERIRELKRGLAGPAIAPEPCGAVEVRPVPRAVDRPGSELDGVYRFEVTDRALRAQGLTDEALIADAHGVITYSMNGGEYCWRQRAPNQLSNPEECGSYRVVGARLVFDGDIRPAVIYRWRKASGGDLELSVLQGSGPVDLMIERAFASNTWERIGDP